MNSNIFLRVLYYMGMSHCKHYKLLQQTCLISLSGETALLKTMKLIVKPMPDETLSIKIQGKTSFSTNYENYGGFYA